MASTKSPPKPRVSQAPPPRKCLYGWLPDIPDNRDHLYGALRRIPAKLPLKADLRPLCSPVEDQKDLGSCTAKALAGALEYQILSHARLNTLVEMRACLAEGYPFVFGFAVYESFESQNVAKTGVVDLPKSNSAGGGDVVLSRKGGDRCHPS